LPTFWRRILIGALTFIGYYTLAKTGLLLATINKSASPIWPATGFAIAVLCLGGRRYTPAIAIAAFVANFQTHIPILAVLSISIGNTLEGVVGSLLFERFTQRKKTFSGAAPLAAMGLSALFATPISATIGASVLLLVGAIGRSDFGLTWFTWWIGDTLGALIFAPFFIRFFQVKITYRHPRRLWLALLVLSGALSWFVFFHSGHSITLLFTIYPIFLIAVFFLSARESSAVALLFTIAAVLSTVGGKGPFIIGSTNDNLICIALFLTSLAITEQGLHFVKETGKFRLAAIVLLSGWLLSAIVLESFTRNEDAIDHTRFQQMVDGTLAQFSERASLYEAALRGGVGFFQTFPAATSQEWRNFVETLDINRNYVGLRGLGHVVVVPHSELKSFVARMKREGNPNFEYRAISLPPGEGPPPESLKIHFIVAGVEPFERNASASGLDNATDLKRYEAVTRAARTGLPEVSEPVRLVQDSKARMALILYMPIFLEAPPKKLIGWVSSPLIFDEFIENGLEKSREIAFEIYFGDDRSNSANPLFTNVKNPTEGISSASIRSERTLWGQTFVFHWYRTPAFRSRHDTTSVWVLFACALLNILLCAFIAILEGLGRRANELANRQAGEIRAQQAKLEHSARLATLGEMAGGIAHEINNPLAILSGRAHLLGRLAAQGNLSSEVVRQNSDKIMETVDRMAKIISGLRSFSRNGERDPFRAVSLDKIFNSTMDFCSERFRNQQIELRIGTVPNVELVCREVQVVQVLLNLLNNAFDAVMATDVDRWIAFNVQVLPTHIEFSVADSGLGIPENVVEHIMTPFFTTKPVGHGTGLGLSISSGIAEEHAGSLRYDPESQNTRFVFSVSRTLQS
jgi:signal transduction histidine kinase/integral membrane sensor domain MASE1